MVEFFVVVEGGFPPCAADASALGSLPTAGFRYCEPVREASRFGWYVFLPYQLSIVWEHDDIFWSLDGFENKYILDSAIQYPNFAPKFDDAAPDSAVGYSPPFLSRTNDEDIVQIWTGVFARTISGTNLWVRGPVNLPFKTSFHVLEGVVETDWWFGPLFANVRITARQVPVVFRETRPFLQVLPFQKAFGKATAKEKPLIKTGIEALTRKEWKDYQETIVSRMKKPPSAGDYAVKSRKETT